ncbi:MAG TPA: phosphoenolpyruvate synthase [Candidatus Bathyarchaeia archaeon]|nr:phosphoenolpyruvate synthase [Candidatus Bathyarchaeia archaeon]
MKQSAHIVWFDQVDKDDIGLVGGKGANLGEMTSFGIPVPPGFMVTAQAYEQFLEENQLEPKISKFLKEIDSSDPQSYQGVSQRIKKVISQGKIPKEVAREIINSYLKLGKLFKHSLVSVRSSATAEDLPTASFAGQQATFLNVQGEASLVDAVRQCWASLFEPRAIFYREEQGFAHLKVAIAVIVQEMVQSDTSGVMFTLDPISNQKNRIVIEAIYGLGELIVQGSVTPDHYLVDRKSLKILKKKINEQAVRLVKVRQVNKHQSVPLNLRLKQKITNAQIRQLAKLGKKIHQHYFFPQDIEWAIEKGKIFILQTRPVTTIVKAETSKDQAPREIKRQPILKGLPASPGIGSGPVKIIKSAKEIGKVEKGDVLVTSMTTPDFVPAMKKVVAIVTDKGGQTSHAAIVSRELGVPCIVGTKKATQSLRQGMIITVSGSEGEIYRGGYQGREVTLTKPQLTSAFLKKQPVRTATKIYVNLASPELAEETAKRQVDGVGLLRAEFMMADIGVHPKKIIRDRKQKMFVDKLSSNLATFCKNFSPRPIVYRTTDFKTNEYRNLTGGKGFEPEEENPMLGYRGAFRYLADPEVFEMELEAIKKVRHKMNLKNLWLMIPFVRTPEELIKVKRLIGAAGLARSPSFKIWLMVEIPSNVILLEEFIKAGIDGVSIGSNDLTMLIMGVDRDNAELADVFDERHPAVLWALEKVIKACNKAKITSSICGQAPSIYPELAQKLVEWGITSLSVNPDAIESTRQLVAETEKRKVRK